MVIRFLTILAGVFILITGTARADRWFVATALDTEGYESGYSNTVQTSGWHTSGITFAWTPNTEPDIYGYRFYVKDAPSFDFIAIDVEIPHRDYCAINLIENECSKTFSIEDPQNIQIGRVP